MSDSSVFEYWLRHLPKDEVLPPFCVELVLRDGVSLYVHSAVFDEEPAGDLTIRVWDLRAFDEGELEDLRVRLNGVKSRSELNKPENVHPKLDWAIFRGKLAEVRYCMEWHDRLWPQEDRPEPKKLGFTS